MSQILHGKYSEIRFIAKGSQGATYLLESTTVSGKSLVIGKCIDDDLVAEHEAETLRMLNHRNIVRYLDYFTDEAKKCWLIMEYCDDGDLNNMLQTRRSNNSLLSKSEILNIFGQVMESVKYLHAMHIIHRDIKPSNILLTAGQVKLGDFGIARKFDPNGPAAMTFIGTAPYMSPEIFCYDGYSQSADLWACGCVLYELCCLERLIASSHLVEIIQAIKSGMLPNLDEQHDGYFSEPFRELICLNPAERISAEMFLIKYSKKIIESRKHVLLVGMVGVGKSSLGNLIAGRAIFKTSDGVASCTTDHKVFQANDTGITIIDTMGMADPNESDVVIRQKISEALLATTDGVDLIFFCMQLGKITRESYSVFQCLMTQYGDECCINLCLVLTRSSNQYVLGEHAAENRNAWIRNQKRESGEAGRMFREIFNACRGKFIFIENPPIGEDSQSEKPVRDTCRKYILHFIESTTVRKFTSEAALKAKEEAKRKDAFASNLVEEIRETQKQLKQQQTAATKYLAECENWKRKCGLQNKYDSIYREYIEEKRRRDLAHDSFCRRKRCPSWLSIVSRKQRAKPSDETSSISLIVLWHQHCETCENCQGCEICSLENKLDKLYADREKVIELIESGRCFAETPDVVILTSKLKLLAKEEWKAKCCIIL